jgi:adenylate cyclase
VNPAASLAMPRSPSSGSRPPATGLRLLLPVVCFGAAWLLSRQEVVQLLEWRTLDWRTQLRTHFQPPADPRVAVILYDDNTQAAIPWPPDRSVHGDLIALTSNVKPAVLAFDFILDAPREGEGDGAMATNAEAVAAIGTKVITAAVTSSTPGEPSEKPGPTQPLTHIEGEVSRILSDREAILPYPALRAGSLYGFADTPPGRDGLRREIPLLVRVGERVYASLALQTVIAYLDVPHDAVHVRLGDAITFPTKDGEMRIPVSASGRFLLNYRYDRSDLGEDFLSYSYLETLIRLTDFFTQKKPFARPPPKLERKIVFVGQFITGSSDIGPTPLNEFAPLVFVHANVVNNVLAHDYARRANPWAVWLGALLVGYATLAIAHRRAIWVMTTFVVLTIAVYITAACAAWINTSLWLPLVAPLSGFAALSAITVGHRVLIEQRAKQEVKGMFSTYVSPQLVDRLVKSGERPKLGGHYEEITAYFSDIQGFSTFSEALPADQLVELMNEYLTACTDIVQDEGGTLDKYIGDAVVAMFGAPVPLPDHALRACIASQRIQLKQAELRAKWQEEGTKWPGVVGRMRTRIGLNSGRCIVGNMGSRTRFNYTMMGDDVNLAARMESGAKSWGVYSMCTEATKLACESSGPGRVIYRPLGRIVVKGRTQVVPIHEIVGLRESVSVRALECVGIFTEGLERYQQRDWDGAIARFRQSAALEPEAAGKLASAPSNPSLVYIEIAECYKVQPPPADWDGSYLMTEK